MWNNICTLFLRKSCDARRQVCGWMCGEYKCGERCYRKGLRMQVEKRNKYIDNIYVATHTVSGIVDENLNLSKTNGHKKIKKSYHKLLKDRDTEVTYLMLNPNKGMPDNRMIESYSLFKEVLEQIFEDIHGSVDKFHIRRADLSINTDVSGDFELYKKLHRLILCCISIEYDIINTYESYDLWTCKNLNLAIKSTTIEAENYDKEVESHGAVPTTNRLELRTKQIADGSTLDREFAEKWCKRLELARMNFKDVQQKYNDNLERLYKSDLQKPKKERNYLSLNAFLMQYSDCIFCTEQMVDLVSRFEEVSNPKIKAENFKKAHKIEYFSQHDLDVVIRAIKKKIKEYFKK